jgi:carboxymethylenebutenolidase
VCSPRTNVAESGTAPRDRRVDRAADRKCEGQNPAPGRRPRAVKTLSNAWDQHLASEFAAKSTDQALATMMADPYVNVVPLMIGAGGRIELHDFYANHFLSQIPPDMEMVTVSRTIGQDRVVDELVARFTHSIHLDWLLPGVAPTGKRVEFPFVVIVQFVAPT